MDHPSCLPKVHAFLNTLQNLGVVASNLTREPVLVEVDLHCRIDKAPQVACVLDEEVSAHGTIALTQATGALEQAAQGLQDWIRTYAPILVDNRFAMHFTAGVFQGPDRTAMIVNFTSTHGRLSLRGKPAEFEAPFTALLGAFGRMQGGTRTFQSYDSAETSHQVRAADAASAMAYHALVFEGHKRWATGKWCEVFDSFPYTNDVARLLEGNHG